MNDDLLMTRAKLLCGELLGTKGYFATDVATAFNYLRAAVEAERATIRGRLDARLNDYLCEMKEGYDDSITGFNEAWDLARKLFDEIEAVRARKP
jgi:hypothetical protein